MAIVLKLVGPHLVVRTPRRLLLLARERVEGVQLAPPRTLARGFVAAAWAREASKLSASSNSR
eukprot:6183440-Pleurochrysis_carterae.AAC.2